MSQHCVKSEDPPASWHCPQPLWSPTYQLRPSRREVLPANYVPAPVKSYHPTMSQPWKSYHPTMSQPLWSTTSQQCPNPCEGLPANCVPALVKSYLPTTSQPLWSATCQLRSQPLWIPTCQQRPSRRREGQHISPGRWWIPPPGASQCSCPRLAAVPALALCNTIPKSVLVTKEVFCLSKRMLKSLQRIQVWIGAKI